jgi:tetratricopeptide (TPR) repeat protein
VALVCGVAGAFGYSYFFGPTRSDDKKSSDKGQDSGKGQEPGNGSAPGKGPATSQSAPSKAELRQAQEAWTTAVKELREARASERAARRAEEDSKAIVDFLKKTLLSAGRSGDGALAEAFWSGGQGKDMTLRKALDGAERQVADAFADRPLAEASVREMLGLGYLNVGDAAQAVKQYERALALREAIQGSNQPDSAACRNQLAVAYRLAGRSDEAARLFDRNPSSPAQASAMAVRGSILLLEKKPDQAERELRESLKICERVQPDDWTTFDTQSSLGEALLDQHKYADAEPLLLSGYRGLKQREDAIPSQEKPRLSKALERLVRLYDSWGKEDEAKKWRKELAAAR